MFLFSKSATPWEANRVFPRADSHAKDRLLLHPFQDMTWSWGSKNKDVLMLESLKSTHQNPISSWTQLIHQTTWTVKSQAQVSFWVTVTAMFATHNGLSHHRFSRGYPWSPDIEAHIYRLQNWWTHLVGYCHLPYLAKEQGKPQNKTPHLMWSDTSSKLVVAKHISWKLLHSKRMQKWANLVAFQDFSPFTFAVGIHWNTEFVFCFLLNVSMSLLYGTNNLRQSVSSRLLKYFQAVNLILKNCG